MKLNEIIEKLELKVLTRENGLDAEIAHGYASDLLSDVMGNANEGDVWVTLQIHKNIIAVAMMKSLAGIILINSREPEAETLAKANEEKIPIMQSRLPAFEIVGRLYALGITGMDK